MKFTCKIVFLAFSFLIGSAGLADTMTFHITGNPNHDMYAAWVTSNGETGILEFFDPRACASSGYPGCDTFSLEGQKIPDFATLAENIRNDTEYNQVYSAHKDITVTLPNTQPVSAVAKK